MTPSKETMLAWQNRPQKLVAEYIKNHLFNNGKSTRSRRETFHPNETFAYEDEGPGTKLRTDSFNSEA